MSNQKQTAGGFNFMTALIAIVISLVIGWAIYAFILGDPANFDAEGHPKQGNYLGMMHAGGFIVPILMAIFIIIVTFSIERFITIAKAKGKGRADVFLRNIKMLVANGQYQEAIAACDKQQGSLANVVRSGIEKLQNVQNDPTLNNEDKTRPTRTTTGGSACRGTSSNPSSRVPTGASATSNASASSSLSASRDG
jgi:biopolymer transport protein ExbB